MKTRVGLTTTHSVANFDADGWITLRVTDRISNEIITEVRIPLAEFSKMITGTHVEAEADVFADKANRWGKEKETKVVIVPEQIKDADGREVWAANYAADNGWGSVSIRKTNRATHEAVFAKWVKAD